MEWKILKIIRHLFLIFAVIPLNLEAQRHIRKNPHVQYEVRQKDDHYIVDYTFLNPFDNLETFSIQLPVAETIEMIDVFGIPASMFEPFVNTPEVLAERQKQLQKGLFLLRNRTIEVDKNALVDLYSEPYCRPIAEYIVASLTKYGRDNRQNRIEFAMNFVQDIPYGIPRYNDKTMHYGGVFPPPKILIEGYGDCDSKAVLFAGIMIYLIGPEEFVFLNQSDHVLSAIRGEPEKGMAYVRFKGDTYLIAETAGPGRRKPGEKGRFYQARHTIEPLSVEKRELIPMSPFDPSHFHQAGITGLNDLSIILKNLSDRSLRVQVSTDNTKWKQIVLSPHQTMRVHFEQKEEVLIRFREDRSNMRTIKIEMGKNYSFIYNQRRGKWSFSST
jgi:hypothetical protein